MLASTIEPKEALIVEGGRVENSAPLHGVFNPSDPSAGWFSSSVPLSEGLSTAVETRRN